MSEPLHRSTLWPYDERGEAREFYYQRYASPTVAAAEAAVGELDGGTALLFPSRSAGAAALGLSQLEPGGTGALVRGGDHRAGPPFAPPARGGPPRARVCRDGA